MEGTTPQTEQRELMRERLAVAAQTAQMMVNSAERLNSENKERKRRLFYDRITIAVHPEHFDSTDRDFLEGYVDRCMRGWVLRKWTRRTGPHERTCPEGEHLTHRMEMYIARKCAEIPPVTGRLRYELYPNGESHVHISLSLDPQDAVRDVLRCLIYDAEHDDLHGPWARVQLRVIEHTDRMPAFTKLITSEVWSEFEDRWQMSGPFLDPVDLTVYLTLRRKDRKGKDTLQEHVAVLPREAQFEQFKRDYHSEEGRLMRGIRCRDTGKTIEDQALAERVEKVLNPGE